MISSLQTRRQALGLIASAPLVPVFATQGQAASEAFYTPEKFAAAQATGQQILVHVWAGWCPTCKAQEAVLKPLLQKPKYKNLTVLTLDFDVQKDFKASHNIRQQSVLLLFKGKTEVAREIGVTNPASIEAFLDKLAV